MIGEYYFECQEQGTAMLEYQRKPYLVPLRVIRQRERMKKQIDGDLFDEHGGGAASQLNTFGYLITSSQQWIKVPKGKDDTEMSSSQKASKFILKGDCYGIRARV